MNIFHRHPHGTPKNAITIIVEGMTEPHNLGQPSHDPTAQQTFYDAVGGEETFRTVVHRFYQGIRNDDLIGPMYPQDDWEGAENRLRWFLAQYWGGPQEFTENRGHPRLRMRHAHFTIGEKEAQRWLDIMGQAIDSIDSETLPPAHRAAMLEHMNRVSNMLINSFDH